MFLVKWRTFAGKYILKSNKIINHVLNFNLYKKLGSCCLITFLAITSIVHTHEIEFRKTLWNSLSSDWNIALLLLNSIMSPCLNENWAMHTGLITVYILCISYKTIFKCNKTPKIRINLTINVFNRVAVAVLLHCSVWILSQFHIVLSSTELYAVLALHVVSYQ